MPNSIRSFEVSSSTQSEATKPLENGDGYEVIGPVDFPSFTPKSFRHKCDSATRIVSVSASNEVIEIFNFRRVDERDVEEHPYGYIVASGSQAVAGSYLEHGDWDGRTTSVSPAFVSHMSASGLGNFFLAHPPDGIQSGSLAQLTGGDAAAFQQFQSSESGA